MNRTGIIAVVLGVLIAVGVVLWMIRDADHAEEAIEPTAATETPATDNSRSASGDEDVSAETLEDPGYVTRLPNYGAASDPSDLHWTEMELPLQFTPTNLVRLSQQLIDSALQGDLNANIEFMLAKSTCDEVPRTHELLAVHISEVQEWAQRSEVGVRGKAAAAAPPGTPVGSNEEIQQRESQWFETCAKFRDLFDSIFDRVERLAVAGEPGARLLYLQLQPTAGLTPGWIDRLDRWEALARGFTEANLEEGRIEGLLGGAMAYSAGRGIKFLVVEDGISTAYLMAAMLCGADHPVFERLLRFLDEMGGQTNARNLDRKNRSIRMAQDLHARYCLNAP